MSKKSAGRRLDETEAMAYAHALKTSPRKLNLVAEAIRGKTCEGALAELAFSRKRISGEVRKLLQSAIANAENNHQLDVDRLYVAEASVGRGFALRRWHARARGRSGRINKYYSTMRVVVREREETA